MPAEMEEYETLSRCQKVRRIAPAILPILLLSVILPTADVGTDLVLITKLYKGVTVCERGSQKEWLKCENDGAEKYCTPEKVSNNTICGISQYDCDNWIVYYEEYRRCQ